MSRIVEIVGRSETGQVRDSNEDRCLIVDLDRERELDPEGVRLESGERGPLLVVCDGMGGEAGGEVASSIACKAIQKKMLAYPPSQDRSVLARNLRSAVRKANQKVCAAAAADKSLRGMGTTVSVVAVVANTAVVAQVGDSRAYVLRGKKLTQITRDQSVVSALVHSGQLSEERAQYSMQRGRVLQALGASEDVDVSLSIAELREGDRLLLCSDGLHDYVAHEEIAKAAATPTLAEAVSGMIALADAAGGADNVTAVLAEIRGGGLPAAMEGDDELRFTELDPSLEGSMALSTTSIVSRRLAHQAGLRKDGWPLTIPATSQHPIVKGDEDEGAAERAFALGSKFGPIHWLLIACVGLGALFYALTWV